MRIAILGSGGVGGYYGARLAAAGADVHFIARGAHLAAMRAHGLRIDSFRSNLHLPQVQATDDPATIGPVDVVLFAVKLYDVDAAIPQIRPLLGPSTVVIPVQNGVDSVDRVTAAIGREHVVGGTTYISALVAEPGVIRHVALDSLVFGPLSGPPPAALVELKALADRAGFTGILSERILVDIWSKFVRLTVFSGITATVRSPIGPIRTNPALNQMLEAALNESIAVARAKQVPLPATILDIARKGINELPPHAKASMLEDLERGRRLELPWLSGAVVRIGEELGVPTPTHKLFVTLLQLHVNGAPAPDAK